MSAPGSKDCSVSETWNSADTRGQRLHSARTRSFSSIKGLKVSVLRSTTSEAAARAAAPSSPRAAKLRIVLECVDGWQVDRQSKDKHAVYKGAVSGWSRVKIQRRRCLLGNQPARRRQLAVRLPRIPSELPLVSAV